MEWFAGKVNFLKYSISSLIQNLDCRERIGWASDGDRPRMALNAGPFRRQPELKTEHSEKVGFFILKKIWLWYKWLQYSSTRWASNQYRVKWSEFKFNREGLSIFQKNTFDHNEFCGFWRHWFLWPIDIAVHMSAKHIKTCEGQKSVSFW